MTDSGPRGSDGKVTERKKGTGEIKSKKIAKDNKSIQKDISITPRECKVYKGASSFLIS